MFWEVDHPPPTQYVGTKTVLIFTSSYDMMGLRQYDVMERVSVQDEWIVEIRKRLSGKNKGQLYNVWVTPQKRLLYTMSLWWHVSMNHVCDSV